MLVKKRSPHTTYDRHGPAPFVVEERYIDELRLYQQDVQRIRTWLETNEPQTDHVFELLDEAAHELEWMTNRYQYV
jgi:hypothetical protein